MKQLGSHILWDGCTKPGYGGFVTKCDVGGKWRVLLRNSKGGDPSAWPEDLRVREFPFYRQGVRS